MFWAARALQWYTQRVFLVRKVRVIFINAYRNRDRFLQFWILNEEFLVNAGHQPALITSLPFVHTARRTYRLNGPVKPRDCGVFSDSSRELVWTSSFRGRWSRNKVSVGEPAEGSLPHLIIILSTILGLKIGYDPWNQFFMVSIIQLFLSSSEERDGIETPPFLSTPFKRCVMKTNW